MKENKTKPDIRFKGFTEAWEQRKVSKITKFHKQGFYTIEDYNDNKKYYLLRGTDFSENKLLLKDTPKINATKKDYEAFKTELGDFLIVRSGTVGTYGIVDVDIPAIFGSYLIDFRFDMEQVTNEFFGYFYQSDLFKSQLNKIIQTSANTNINAENIKSTVISLPNLDEQRKISEYLGNLDHLITLHQRECDQLKELKKSMLKKMFPRDESSIPEVRFAGFTDAWEQRKLGTLCSLITKGTTPKDKSGNGEVNFIKVENIDIDNGEITSTSKISIAEHEGYLKRSKLKENDILFSIAGTLGRVSVVKSSILPANTNQALAILRINEGYIPYLTTVLKGQAVEDFIRRNPTIGAQPNLSLEQVNNLDISYPNYDEQVRIGQYFSNLDHLITLHQRNYNSLNRCKFSKITKNLLISHMVFIRK